MSIAAGDAMVSEARACARMRAMLRVYWNDGTQIEEPAAPADARIIIAPASFLTGPYEHGLPLQEGSAASVTEDVVSESPKMLTKVKVRSDQLPNGFSNRWGKKHQGGAAPLPLTSPLNRVPRTAQLSSSTSSTTKG